MANQSIAGGETIPHPTSLPELEDAEQLLLWSLRRLAGGTREWTLVERELARQLGQMDGMWAMRAAIGFMSRLARGARRRVRCHKACCALLAPDEVSMLLIVSAAANGERALASTFANWLVHNTAVEEVLEVAERLGRHLNAGGHTLPMRGMAAPVRAGVPVPVSPTWH